MRKEFSMQFFGQLILLLVAAFTGNAQQISTSPTQKTARHDIPVKELATWKIWGKGNAEIFQDGLLLKESAGSIGFMLVSPSVFPHNFVLRYSVVPLSASTVLIAVLQSADSLHTTSLSLPEAYDGNMAVWNEQKRSYMIAFKNAPHASTPFIIRQPGGKPVKAASQDLILVGISYEIEIGIHNGKLWLAVDGKELVSWVDPQPYPGGHIALRIRGLPGLPAACLLRNLSVQELKK